MNGLVSSCSSPPPPSTAASASPAARHTSRTPTASTPWTTRVVAGSTDTATTVAPRARSSVHSPAKTSSSPRLVEPIQPATSTRTARPYAAGGTPYAGPVMAEDADAFRWRHLWTGVPAVVWWVTALFAALLVAWTVLTPAYQAPDEPKHVDRALAAAHGELMPAPKGRTLGLGIDRSLTVSGLPSCCPPPRFAYRLDQAPPADQRPSIDALGGLRPTTNVNQLTAHPPGYYAYEGLVALLMPSDWGYDATLEGLRLASALLVAPLPLLLFAAARRFAGEGPVAVAAAVLPLGLPQLTFLGASVTNDAGMVLTGGLVTVLAAYVLTGDTSRRTALWFGLVSAAAIMVKFFGFTAFVVLGASYLVASWRAGRARPTLDQGGFAAGVGLLVGGWYWVRNVVLYGAVQPDGGAYLPPPAPPGWHASPVHYFLRGYPARMLSSFVGKFGWLADPLPAAVTGLWVALMVLGVLLALRLRRTRRARWTAADVVILCTPLVLLYWGVGLRAYHGYVLRASLGANQGRYLYFGLAGLFVAMALGLRRLSPAALRWAPLGVLAFATALQALAVHDVLHYFWGPPGVSLTYRLHDVVAWSAWTAEPLALVGVVAAVSLVAAAVTSVRLSPSRAARAGS